MTVARDDVTLRSRDSAALGACACPPIRPRTQTRRILEYQPSRLGRDPRFKEGGEPGLARVLSSEGVCLRTTTMGEAIRRERMA